MAASSWLRVAVVQFAPKFGEVHANIAKARELCRGFVLAEFMFRELCAYIGTLGSAVRTLGPSIDRAGLTLILSDPTLYRDCLPDPIPTCDIKPQGYMFPDAPSIAPYLEHPRTGPTSTFCAQLARDLQCYVVAGLPQRLEPSLPSGPSHVNPSSSTCDVPSSLLGANAALLFDPNGQLLHTYHKSNLFPTDLPWARPGPGFTTLDLPHPFGRTALAICNDLNVSVQDGNSWQSIEWGPYELARYCKREGVRVLVLLNAWLKSGDEAETSENENDEETLDDEDAELEPNWQVLNYWAMRLRPLWAEDSHAEEDEKGITVIICNRFGCEQGKIFVGSSAMFSMRKGSGKPRLLHAMGEQEEGVSVWTTRLGMD